MHQTPSPLNIGNIGRDDFNVRQMACGDGHVLLLTEQGHVWSVGKGCSNSMVVCCAEPNAGENGQLGLGDTLGSRPQPKLVMFLTDQAITSVAAGGNQSACLDELGRLYEWGQAAEGKPLVSKPALKV
jgi:alpha-tubulin suppressor-like RCC1 family protein